MSDEVDPRYDPRFQRGYDPARHPAPKRPVEPRTASPDRMIAPPPVASAADEPRAAVADPVEDRGEDVLDVPPRRNVPVLALLFGGTALVLLALGMLVNAALDPNPLMTRDTRFWAPVWNLVRTLLPSPLLISGIVAVAVGVALRSILRRGA